MLGHYVETWVTQAPFGMIDKTQAEIAESGNGSDGFIGRAGTHFEKGNNQCLGDGSSMTVAAYLSRWMRVL